MTDSDFGLLMILCIAAVAVLFREYKAALFVLVATAAVVASAQQQPAPSPAAATAAENAIAASKAVSRPSPPPPPQPARSNGSSGWVDAKKPAHISLADIPAMFPSR